jgi:hypothetical protein
MSYHEVYSLVVLTPSLLVHYRNLINDNWLYYYHHYLDNDVDPWMLYNIYEIIDHINELRMVYPKANLKKT